MRQPRLARLLWPYLIVFLLPAGTWAQCTLDCAPGPIDLPLGPTCSYTVMPTDLIGPNNDCMGAFTVQIFDGNGVPVFGNTLTSFYLYDTLVAVLTHQMTSQSCTTSVRPVDVIPPSILDPCIDAFIGCNADTSALAVGSPIFQDNCGSGNLTVTWTDDIQTGSCPSQPFVISRTFVAEDQGGNSTGCTQAITLSYPAVQNPGVVTFPPDITLDCAGNPFDFGLVGSPELQGNPLVPPSDLFCDLDITFQDNSVVVGDTLFIGRTWQVTNCVGATTGGLQAITVIDDDDPVIECPDDITVGASGMSCSLETLLPFPDTTYDGCSAVVDTLVTTSFGGVGLGPHVIPVGTHTITYTAVDAIGNTASCTMSYTVEDQDPPMVTCIDLSPTLQPSGNLTLLATQLASGNDNCGPVTLLARRLDGNDPLAASVDFDCADVGTTVEVQVVGTDPSGLADTCIAEVHVSDKTAPLVFECPSDTLIDCATFNGDPNSLPTATFTDGCGIDTIEITVLDSLDKCGVGTVTRLFTAFDPSGNSATCGQVITIGNSQPLSENLITWPLDTLITSCLTPEFLEPENLDPPYNEPVVDGAVCSIVAVGHKDEVLIVTLPGCYKILRKWTVIDWCIYDPNDPSSGGIFTHTQLIKVLDMEPPVLDCPDTYEVASDGNCGTAMADLSDVIDVTDNCNPNVTVTNDYNNGGADPSGMFPPGVTTITFTATDGCANYATCQVDIVVTDLTPPTPQCLHGLSTNLGLCEGEVVAKIQAEFFDQYSHDNCSLNGDLTFSYSDDITDTVRTFTCADRDTAFVDIWVTDENGNQDFCSTYIIITDNMGMCPGGKPVAISGAVLTPAGEGVAGATVAVEGPTPASTLTAEDGTFTLADLTEGGPYILQAAKSTDPLFGVSTYDLLLIQKHLLGINPLPEPYQLVAADANQSGNLSIGDVITLRKWLLNPVPDVTPQAAWRFLNPAIPMSGDPFNTPGLEEITIEALTEDLLGVELTAIKVGDINGDAFLNESQLAATRGDRALALIGADQQLTYGQAVDVIFTAADFQDILSWQMALGWDPAELQFAGMQTLADELQLNAGHFGLRDVDEGLLRLSWSTAHGASLDARQPVFKLRFQALADGRLSDMLHLAPSALRDEAAREINTQGQRTTEMVQVRLDWEASDTADPSAFILYPNRPNPFHDMTMIGFRLPEAADATLTLLDISGRVITQFRGKYPPGYHEMSVPGDILPASGVIYYRLEAGAFSETKKMIRQ